MNLILTGLRGTGKTTIGKLLAAKLDRPFIDIDNAIEKTAKQPISAIVKNHGWDYFREIEHKVCKKIVETGHGVSLRNCVVSTGGGTLIFDRNYQLFKKNSFIVLLTANLNEIATRISSNKNRPSLTEHKNFIDELEDIWNQRKKKYQKIADLIIDTSEQNADKIIKKIIDAFTPTNHHR